MGIQLSLKYRLRSEVAYGIRWLRPASGVPSWVARDGAMAPAILMLDLQNNRGWYNGKAYSTEAAALAAVNGTASGGSRTIGDYVAPDAPELLPNGDLSAGIGAWTAVNGAAAAVVNGELEMSGTGLTNPSVRSAAAATQQGKAYRAKASYRKGTATGSPLIVNSRATALSPLSNGMSANSTTNSIVGRRTFGGEGAAHYLGLRTVSGPGGTVYADNFSVKEAVAFEGFSTPAFAAVIRFMTPATLPAAAKVLFSFDDDGARNRYKAEIAPDGSMVVILASNGTDRASYTIPANLVTLNAEHKLHISFDGATRFFVAFDDVNLFGQQGGYTPAGACWIRLGASVTAGSEWTGTILSAALFAHEYAPPRFIWAVGDSYVAGTGGASVEQGIEASAPARLAVASGAGGSSIATQLGLMQSNPGLHGCILVHWDGDANSFNAEADPAVFEQMAALASRHIFVGSGIRVNHTATERLNTAARNGYLAGRFGDRYLDPMPILLGLSTGSTEDQAAVALGCIPPSCLQADGTHLTPTAMAAVGAAIVAKIAAKGW